MIDIYRLYPLLYCVFNYLYEINNRVENRYIKGNSLIIYNTSCLKYDGVHDFYLLLYIFNIRMCTFKAKNYIKFKVYLDNTKISEFTLIDNKSANGDNIKIVQTILFMDDLYTINRLIIYNCGIIVHSNYYGSHIYNYKGERRTVKYIDNFDNITNITYIE